MTHIRPNIIGAAISCSIAVTGTSLSTASAADDFPSTPAPNHGFYAGLGAAGNYTSYNNWDVDATGISDVYEDDVLVTSGSAGGPAVDLDLDSSWSFTPQLQIGYFDHIADSKWIWGGKLTYNYMKTSSTRENFLIPQFGSFDPVDKPPEEFTGNAVVQSMEIGLSHQFAMIPYLGRGFERGFAYAGAGPTLSKVDTDVTNLIGFADVAGRPRDISGAPQDFASSDWVFGGAATIGGTYFVGDSWFIDMNYTFSRTFDYTADYYSTFQNPGPDLSFTGELIGEAGGTFTTHTFAFSINRAF